MTTLLLIEDHAPLRKNLRDILTLEGYRVLEAATGPDGLRAAREQRPDLVVCDIMLPGCDGLEILAAIRTRLTRAAQQRPGALDFSSAAPLEKLGITPREAEVLLWMAQGKANHDIATILGCTHATVKKHTIHIFEKLSVESRGAAMLIAIEVLSSS